MGNSMTSTEDEEDERDEAEVGLAAGPRLETALDREARQELERVREA